MHGVGGASTNCQSNPMSHKKSKLKVVVIGGGSGISNILMGLKQHPVDITAIVTMFDSGGSSGLLRAEYGYPPFGDLRQCLLALGDDTHETQAIRDALSFRFGADTSLNGHSVGNLLLAALTSLSNDLELALGDIGQILRVSGRVIPVTLERADLCAELEDGRIIQGESGINLRGTPLPRIKHIFLEPEVQANPRAIHAVTEADAIILGPGDLYTSILPNLLVRGVSNAVASSKGTRIYVCNLMTKCGETDEYDASDFVNQLTRYMSPDALDWVLVNTSIPPATVQQAYRKEGADVVEPVLEKLSSQVKGVIATPLASTELPLHHDRDRTAKAIFQAVHAGRVSRTIDTGLLTGSPVGLPEAASRPPRRLGNK